MTWVSARATVVAVLVLVAGLATGCTEQPVVAEFVPYRDPLWTAGREERGPVVVVGDFVVADAGDALSVFDRQRGGRRWQLQRGHQTRLWVGDAAIVEYGAPAESQPDALRVIDLDTGAASPWQQATLVDVTQDTLVTERCTSPPDRYSCVLTAVDLATRAVLWQTAEDPDDIVGGPPWTAKPDEEPWNHIVEPMRGHDTPTLVFHESGRTTNTVTVVDIRTGRRLHTWQIPAHADLAANFHTAVVVANTLITVDRVGRDDDDCRTRLAAFDVTTGKPRWQVDTAPWRHSLSHDDYMVEFECDLFDQIGLVDTTLITMTTDRRPQLIDIPTGVVRTFGERGMQPIGFAAGTLVVQDYGTTRDIVTFDAGTGRERWRVKPAPRKSPEFKDLPPDTPTATAIAVFGGRLVYRRDNDDYPRKIRLYIADIRQGKLIWATDEVRVSGVGPGWLASGDDRHLSLYPL